MAVCTAWMKLAISGILVSTLGVIIGWVVLPLIIQDQVTKNVRLMRDSDTWNKWADPPIPIYLTFYIHHVTNPDEVEMGQKPIFEEKGPYNYRQRRLKVELTQEDGLNTVKYKEVRTYFFDHEKSGNNSDNDLVNIPNIPFVAVIHTVYKMIPLDIVAALVGNIILQNETLIKRDVRVGDLLFDGFDVRKYTRSLLGRRLPKEFSGDRFGLYKGKNGTATEEWVVFTGYENSNDFGRIKLWDGRHQLEFWQKFSDCDQLSGTDGTVFHPFLTKDTVLEAFSPDVCRSLTVTFQEEMEHRGVPGYRFTTPKWLFEDPRIMVGNQCFCLEKTLEECPHAGALPLESCLKAPIWVSPPYFLDGDVRYQVAAGMTPDREKHGTFLDIEPTTGLLLRAHKRVQINLGVRGYRKVSTLSRISQDTMVFPIFWADENAEIDEKLADEIKIRLLYPRLVGNIVKWIMIGLGIVLVAGGGVVYLSTFTNKKIPVAHKSTEDAG